MIKKICDCCNNETDKLLDLDFSSLGKLGLRTIAGPIDHYEVCSHCYDWIMEPAKEKFNNSKK